MFPFCSISAGRTPGTHAERSKSLSMQPWKSLSEHALADRETASPNLLLPELAQPTPRQPALRQSGRRDRNSPTPLWTSMTAHEMSRLLEWFAQTTSETSDFQAARGVYTDLRIGEYRLRLQALAWSEMTLIDRELSLMLRLKPMANSYLPIGSELTVAEDTLLHSGQNLCWSSHPTCLYTQIFGDWEKQFSVQVSLPGSLSLTLPPLTFLPTCHPNSH